jgi:alpha-L-fucosidase 2
MGALVFGGIQQEKLEIYNSATGPASHDDVAKALQELSAAPVCTLMINLPTEPGKVTDYCRSLALDTAISRVSYRAGGVNYTREVFTSGPSHVFVIRCTADSRGEINFTAKLGASQPGATLASGSGSVSLSGTGGGGGNGRFNAWLLAKNEGGSASVDNGAVTVRDANSATLFVSVAIDETGSDKAASELAANASNASKALWSTEEAPYEQLRAGHVADYQMFFRSGTPELGSPSNRSADGHPRSFEETNDPQLAALLFRLLKSP